MNGLEPLAARRPDTDVLGSSAPQPGRTRFTVADAPPPAVAGDVEDRSGWQRHIRLVTAERIGDRRMLLQLPYRSVLTQPPLPCAGVRVHDPAGSALVQDSVWSRSPC
jgi:hypothetical protein